MEDILMALLQILGEVLLQIFGEFMLQFFLPFIGDLFWWDPSETQIPQWLIFPVAIGAGCFLGWLSILILPRTCIPYGWLRIANVAIAPFVSGMIARGMANIRKRKNPDVDPSVHFWIVYCMTLGLVLYRFTYAVRLHS